MTQKKPFGTWDSPISAQMVTTAGVRLGSVAYVQGAAFWAEARPEDAGRSVIVKCSVGDEPVDLISAPFNARTRVHEYGGGSWWVDNANLYFVHWDDQRLYRVSHQVEASSGAVSSHVPEPITPIPPGEQSYRYADGCVSADGKFLVCVRERHETLTSANLSNDVLNKDSSRSEQHQSTTVVHNEIVFISTQINNPDDDQHISVVVSGADFYSTPRLSGDASQLVWIQWSHPQMPWDGTELVLADVENQAVINNQQIISGDAHTSVMGALWTNDDNVVFASDESGWWNMYRYIPSNKTLTQLTHFNDREVGTPAWIFGTQRFVELMDDSSVVGFGLVVTHQARDQLQVLSLNGDLVAIESPYTTINSIAADCNGGMVLHAQPENSGATITQVDCKPALSNNARVAAKNVVTQLKPAPEFKASSAWLSTPEAISFPSGDRKAHAFFYPPAGFDVEGNTSELPPLIVMGHGGPTSHATAGLKLNIQYWTSRGIAVVDVNYGGSSGFGRDYRRLLNGQWGVVDVQDCVAATEYLSASGRVDPKRMVIRGGSAGGLTVLRALQTSDRFAGGTSLYGVTDLEMLAGDTHKFESRYLDGLLGGPYPEHKATYVERSPITHADQLSCPILVLQGDEDKVVPPNQSAAIVNAAASKGLPHAYVLFAGEQHGFRQTENIIRALQLELWFYGRVLSFTPADDIQAPAEAIGFN